MFSDKIFSMQSRPHQIKLNQPHLYFSWSPQNVSVSGTHQTSNWSQSNLWSGKVTELTLCYNFGSTEHLKTWLLIQWIQPAKMTCKCISSVKRTSEYWCSRQRMYNLHMLPESFFLGKPWQQIAGNNTSFGTVSWGPSNLQLSQLKDITYAFLAECWVAIPNASKVNHEMAFSKILESWYDSV